MATIVSQYVKVLFQFSTTLSTSHQRICQPWYQRIFFALKPEDHQPSGTLNMSRIDTATLMVNTVDKMQTATDRTTESNIDYSGINIYAVNYNVLRILSGMGGLAYSN